MIKMSLAHYLLLPFLCLSQLALHSAQNSTDDRRCLVLFQCGRLGNIGFPFFSIEHPKCGAIAMDCSTEREPKAQFQEEGKWYPVKYINFSARSFEIRDKDVQNHLESNLCDLLNNFTEQAYLKKFNESEGPLFISFNIRDTRPFFKCKCKPNFPSKILSQFHRKSCNNHELYYMKQEESLPPLPQSSFNCCSVVQLPSSSGVSDAAVKDNLTSLWKADFTIEWKLLPECVECFANGGQCQSSPDNSFICKKNDTLVEYREKGRDVGVGLKVKIGLGAGVGSILLTCMAFTIYQLYRRNRSPNLLGLDESHEKGLGAGVGSILLTCMAFTIYQLYRRNRSPNLLGLDESHEKGKPVFSKETRSFEEFIKHQGSFPLKRYSFKEISKMTQTFKIKLGQGGYGSVFKGVLSNGRPVAVKVLSESKGNGEEFINEVASISRTSHVNIVSLLGYCFDGSKRALVYEFIPNGSLDKYIFDKDSSVQNYNLGWVTLHGIAVGIARGLEYLHRGCNTRILHFDIKPHNILLDQDFCPKISDFGLAKLCPRKDSIISMLGARGTAGYIAPEVFCRNFGGISHKSDVYSYGMMILEMVGGRKNIAIAVDHTSEIYFPHWIHKRIEMNVDLGIQGIVSEAQEDISRKMILVGLWCIQTNPLHRPAMSRVLQMLEGSLEALEIPPKPYLSSPPRVEEDSSIN